MKTKTDLENIEDVDEQEANEYFSNGKPKRGYWYHTTIFSCVLCWHEEVYRERRYTPKPDDPAKRYEYIETACYSHFL